MRTLTKISLLFSSIIFSLSLGSNLALADPPEHAPAHGSYKNQNQGHDSYRRPKYDDHDSQYQQQRRYNNDDHGNYRYKNSGHSNNNYNNQGNQRGHNNTLNCDRSGFSSSNVGSVVGGILGGILGSNIGKGKGKTLATIAGVIVGASIGNNIGSSMDDADRYCAGQAFGRAQDNQTVAWTNPDTHREYTVTPDRTYRQDNGRQCRNYTSTVIIDGRQEQATGSACKDHSGNWQIIN